MATLVSRLAYVVAGALVKTSSTKAFSTRAAD